MKKQQANIPTLIERLKKVDKCKWEPIVSSLLRGSSHKNAKVMHKNIE